MRMRRGRSAPFEQETPQETGQERLNWPVREVFTRAWGAGAVSHCGAGWACAQLVAASSRASKVRERDAIGA